MCGNINHRICRKPASSMEYEYINTPNICNPPPHHYKIDHHPNSICLILNPTLMDSMPSLSPSKAIPS